MRVEGWTACLTCLPGTSWNGLASSSLSRIAVCRGKVRSFTETETRQHCSHARGWQKV